MRTLNLVNFSSVILSPSFQISQSPSPHPHPHGLPVKPEITGKQALREKLCLKKATNLVISPENLTWKNISAVIWGQFCRLLWKCEAFYKEVGTWSQIFGFILNNLLSIHFLGKQLYKTVLFKNHPLTASCNKHYIVIWVYLSLLANYDRLQVIQG